MCLVLLKKYEIAVAFNLNNVFISREAIDTFYRFQARLETFLFHLI
jgi:hypothetical protein